jgi:hypothetical protein
MIAPYWELDIPLEVLMRESKPVCASERAIGVPDGDFPQRSPGGLLRAFKGFVPLGDVQKRLPEIPAECGVYVVVGNDQAEPAFIARSSAGWFKKQDPSYPVATLEKKWVRGTNVLYVGKAGPSSRCTLRKRIDELVRFGSGKDVAHRGGRALWQLKGIWGARIAWKTASNDPLSAERALIDEFEREFGRLPFANFRH